MLGPFKLVTMLGQEKGTIYGSIASTLWGFDYLLTKLEKWEKECKRSDTGFRTAVNLSWNLMKKYYKETDKLHCCHPYATQTRVFLRVFSHLLIVFFQRVNDTI